MAIKVQQSAVNLANESICSEKPFLRKSPSASPKKSFRNLRNVNFRMGSCPRNLDEELATSPNVRSGNTRRSVFACGSPESAETDQWMHSVESNSQACSIDRMSSPIHSQFESKIFPKPFPVRNQAKLGSKTCKMLVTVNVLKSTGPLRFVVDVNYPVNRVIELTLQAYAREGRLPALGLESSFMQLYSCDFEALDPLKLVGSVGTRKFSLHRKQPEDLEQANARNARAASMHWKLWWNVKSTIVCSA
ncbi:hypothetical protein O6H91_18G057400 [Diphasiastrum complanatum]|uniref:Uncharacterized protein n=1 Tax=Diphasiastrum complanatum TaxID=34168 RepID=A0ACC2B1J7_DIPCM|nr:hypothetical protein O6H91_18G057400 [Diphasiastrum complanatum]